MRGRHIKANKFEYIAEGTGVARVEPDEIKETEFKPSAEPIAKSPKVRQGRAYVPQGKGCMACHSWTPQVITPISAPIASRDKYSRYRWGTVTVVRRKLSALSCWNRRRTNLSTR